MTARWYGSIRLSCLASLLLTGEVGARHVGRPGSFDGGLRGLQDASAQNAKGAGAEIPAPRLSVETVGIGRIAVRLMGSPRTLYGLEVSPDLKHWTNWLTTTTDASGRAVAMGGGEQSRFVRAVSSFGQAGGLRAEEALGKRLFLETRFAQYYFAHARDDVNQPLSEGDPVMNTTELPTNSLVGPFRGQSMNCRACHLVDEHRASRAHRTYEDFARRSPVPDRGDGRRTAPRNSPSLVNASLARDTPFLLHYDGEFASGVALVRGTFLGRNFGWLPGERDQAVRHIARVIREDDGRSQLAVEFGGAYGVVLEGVDPAIPVALRLPVEYQLEVASATDETIVDGVARLVNAYLEGLVFGIDAEGRFEGSPYDRFLQRNRLPRKPGPGESDLEYGKRLLELLKAGSGFDWITPADGVFTNLNQAFAFGEKELRGLKVFLTSPATAETDAPDGVGNCVACHAPPAFTDYRFHNSGVTQGEYDAVHGPEAFQALAIPSLQQRRQDPAAFLPPSPSQPGAVGRFLSPPSFERPGFTDLGLWNVFANPDLPGPQDAIRAMFRQDGTDGTDDTLLPLTVARFKTPGLRDLGHSAPYFHSGTADTLADAVHFYHEVAHLSRKGGLVNGDPELLGILLSPVDTDALEAFLQALNEDYE